jgi:hypothetical protein
MSVSRTNLSATAIVGIIIVAVLLCLAQQAMAGDASIVFTADCRNSKVTQVTVGDASQTFANSIACDSVMLKLTPVQPGLESHKEASVHLWMLSSPNSIDTPRGVFRGTIEYDVKTPNMTVAVDKVYETLSSNWPPVIDAQGMCGSVALVAVGKGTYDLTCQVVAHWWGHQRYYDISARLSRPDVQLEKSSQ